jgi:hypothetical protein
VEYVMWTSCAGSVLMRGREYLSTQASSSVFVHCFVVSFLEDAGFIRDPELIHVGLFIFPVNLHCNVGGKVTNCNNLVVCADSKIYFITSSFRPIYSLI